MASGIYKSGQGYYTRMGTAVSASLIGLLGLYWLWGYALKWKVGTVNPTYVAAATAIVLGGILTWFVYDLVFRRHSTGDFFIATEGELKKVNWSTRRELVGSTIVVITTMVIVTIFVFFVDKIFLIFFGWIRVIDLPPP
ncbi:MAG: preprotein translocase subunit SecE [Phycisphaerae bacterium]|nr:preprotein translocase subunit SecE [Phycisphaerae bacterium]